MNSATQRIDLDAPWHLVRTRIQREAPGRGRYRVQAWFITGKPPAYEYCFVAYWLPSDTGHKSHTQWLSYREITNSRLHPSAFEGMELPTDVSLSYGARSTANLLDDLADRLAYSDYIANPRNPVISFELFRARRGQPVAALLDRAPDLVDDLKLADQETAAALQREMRQAQEGRP